MWQSKKLFQIAYYDNSNQLAINAPRLILKTMLAGEEFAKLTLSLTNQLYTQKLCKTQKTNNVSIDPQFLSQSYNQ